MNHDHGGSGNILVVRPGEGLPILKSLASDVRLSILEQLAITSQNVNEIASRLKLPQSSVATHVLRLQDAGLIRTESRPGVRGTQKICHLVYDEIVIDFPSGRSQKDNSIDVEMPVGLFMRYDVAPPCGLCGQDAVIGYFDVPEQFLHPERIRAGMVWFGHGLVEYQFPNNLLNTTRSVSALEVTAEISSDIPGTDNRWKTDITVLVNQVELGTYLCEGDFGTRRGRFTPQWRPLNTSQYGTLTRWITDAHGTRVGEESLSDTRISDLGLLDHNSIKVAFAVREEALNRGGLNIFGRGFGDHDQDIILRLTLEQE